MPITSSPELSLEEKLRIILQKINQNYSAFEIRFDLVLQALALARMLKYPCGFRHDETSKEWPVVTIILPKVGQVSWHMPPSGIPWDKSTPEQVKERCENY
jgi:hypothetical protein